MSVSVESRARSIVDVISRTPVDLSSEAAAHQGIARALECAGHRVDCEVRLTPKDRVDLMVDDIAIEVKVRKGQSRRAIMRQLTRYAEHERVAALILATGDAWPRAARYIGGTSLMIASLSRGWL